jgi:hypothetical protein
MSVTFVAGADPRCPEARLPLLRRQPDRQCAWRAIDEARQRTDGSERPIPTAPSRQTRGTRSSGSGAWPRRNTARSSTRLTTDSETRSHSHRRIGHAPSPQRGLRPRLASPSLCTRLPSEQRPPGWMEPAVGRTLGTRVRRQSLGCCPRQPILWLHADTEAWSRAQLHDSEDARRQSPARLAQGGEMHGRLLVLAAPAP